MNLFNFILSFFNKNKSKISKILLTDEELYWGWWASQDIPEVGEIKHPKFDGNGKKIPGEYIIGHCSYTN